MKVILHISMENDLPVVVEEQEEELNPEVEFLDKLGLTMKKYKKFVDMDEDDNGNLHDRGDRAMKKGKARRKTQFQFGGSASKIQGTGMHVRHETFLCLRQL